MADIERGISFIIPLQLQAEVKRQVPIRGKGGAVVNTKRVDKPEAAEFKATARVFAMQAMQAAGLDPYDEPVGVEIAFYRQPPKGRRNQDLWPCTRPDLDNYEKLAFDAMQGVVYVDDARICLKQSGKYWTDVIDASLPHEHIRVRVYPLQPCYPYRRTAPRESER
jgi:Holliday junction resolvase RusA-like endonuclease